MNSKSLSFHETTFQVIDRDGKVWLQAADIASALGYADSRSINKIHSRNADEFTPCMSLVAKLTTNGFGHGVAEKEVRLFSLRGAHLIAMFARTDRAKEFRRWVLDVLDQREAAPDPEAPAVDLRGEVMSNCSTPVVPLPPEVQEAIDARAWLLAREAYELVRIYLARRVAWHTVPAHSPDMKKDRALKTIEQTSLEMALAPACFEQVDASRMFAKIAAERAVQVANELTLEFNRLFKTKRPPVLPPSGPN